MRTEVKYIYRLDFILDEKDLNGDPERLTIAERLAILDEWADASSEGMLKMVSSDPLYGGEKGRLVFLNPLTVRTITLEQEPNRNSKRYYHCSATVQDA